MLKYLTVKSSVISFLLSLSLIAGLVLIKDDYKLSGVEGFYVLNFESEVRGKKLLLGDGENIFISNLTAGSRFSLVDFSKEKLVTSDLTEGYWLDSSSGEISAWKSQNLSSLLTERPEIEESVLDSLLTLVLSERKSRELKEELAINSDLLEKLSKKEAVGKILESSLDRIESAQNKRRSEVESGLFKKLEAAKSVDVFRNDSELGEVVKISRLIADKESELILQGMGVSQLTAIDNKLSPEQEKLYLKAKLNKALVRLINEAKAASFSGRALDEKQRDEEQSEEEYWQGLF